MGRRKRRFLVMLLFLFGDGAVLQAQMDAYYTAMDEHASGCRKEISI